MSQEDLWKALGRSQIDLAFAAQVRTNPEGCIHDAGYSLDSPELDQLKQIILVPAPRALVGPELPLQPPFSEGSQLPPALAQKFMEEQHRFMVRTMELRLSVTEKALDVVKTTFDRAAGTFSTITWMNRLMFGVGIALFVYAAILAASTRTQVYSLLFGGLGAASFITLFMRDPIERIQRALANLVQVQVVFMTYFDQVSWWEALASIPKGNQPDPERIERASAGLQQRTIDALELLHRFVEESKRPPGTKKERDPQKHPAVHPPKDLTSGSQPR
ncbi:MAG TPA: hypothetical protein VKS22_05085 [Candidatus Binataceae bacterium]|nr:hypothetical protein [Candidatus Binataceae bacterium]